jgi:hypothetical protein
VTSEPFGRDAGVRPGIWPIPKGMVPGKRIVIAPESDGKGNIRTTLFTTSDISRSECLAVLTEMMVNLSINPNFMQVDDSI